MAHRHVKAADAAVQRQGPIDAQGEPLGAVRETGPLLSGRGTLGESEVDAAAAVLDRLEPVGARGLRSPIERTAVLGPGDERQEHDKGDRGKCPEHAEPPLRCGSGCYQRPERGANARPSVMAERAAGRRRGEPVVLVYRADMGVATERSG